VQSAKAQFAAERRRIPRNPDRSHQQAKAMEFAAVVLGGIALAGAAVATVEDALATPLSTVRVALGPG
jgi:hypothetical protein